MSYRILHTGDLHLSQRDSEYAMRQWQDIVSIATSRGIDCILICGDLFDSPADVPGQVEDFNDIAASFDGKVLYIPGNHESSPEGFQYLDNFTHADSIELCLDEPFSVHRLTDAIEVVAFPHQAKIDSLEGLKPKSTQYRLGMVHGISQQSYFAEDCHEKGGGTFDETVFANAKFDYVALGHIHLQQKWSRGSTRFCYPGSTRIWRSGEEGDKGVQILTFDESLTTEFVSLPQSGTFHALETFVVFDEIDVPEVSDFSPNDFIEITVRGIASSDSQMADVVKRLRNQFEPLCRKLKLNTTEFRCLVDSSAQKVIRQFFRQYEASVPKPFLNAEDEAVWQTARKLGIMQICEQAEK